MCPPVTGVVFNIQRFCLHDGPGIRTTVFLKGCNFRCAWCHNPESFEMAPKLSFNKEKCSGCEACKGTCNKAKCDGCGQCAALCPTEAKTLIGSVYTVDKVMDVVLRDRIYYGDTGGVTFSGGEPTLQFDFLLALLKKAKEQGLHTCLETNGAVKHENLAQLAQYVDLFLLDFKHSDDTLHQKYVGGSNKLTLQCLELLTDWGKDIILRCPIIPGINDNPAHFEAIGQLRLKFPSIKKVELMPYHAIGVSKWENIGLSYELENVAAPSEAQVEEWERLCESSLTCTQACNPRPSGTPF